MQRRIIHFDLDAFFCAVEEREDASLKGVAFAVGGRPEERGVVASCSYAARQFGVRSALPMSRALRLCPALVIVPSRHHLYSEVSGQVMERLHQTAPLVEQLSIDEAFMDVTGLPDYASVIARRLQAEINTDLGLPCSLGVAASKLVAKIANNVGKAKARGAEPPNAITVVLPGTEAAFLAPLPVGELWGVGPKTAERLNEIGIRTIGDLAGWPAADLTRRFGRHGEELAQRARGFDDRPVEPEVEAKSISQETTFTHDIRDGDSLRRTLRTLCDHVGRRVRAAELSGMTVKIKLRWADFTTLTRQSTLSASINRDDEIYRAALALFEANWPPGKAVRLIGVGLSGFEVQPTRQVGLWEPDTTRQDHLQAALDDLRDRFGPDALTRASLLHDDETEGT